MSGPAKFRKLPVVIEAMHFGSDLTAPEAMEIYHWIESNTLGSFEPLDVIEGRKPYPESGVSIDPRDGRMIISTLEGLHWVSPGDWVIRGVKGEFYPCRADIFTATYELADEPADTNHDLPGNGHCRSCSEPIAWYRTPTGKRMPLDLAPSVDGNVVVDDGVAVALSADALADSDPSVPRYVSHFVTCPDAKSWRGNGGQS